MYCTRTTIATILAVPVLAALSACSSGSGHATTTQNASSAGGQAQSSDDPPAGSNFTLGPVKQSGTPEAAKACADVIGAADVVTKYVITPQGLAASTNSDPPEWEGDFEGDHFDCKLSTHASNNALHIFVERGTAASKTDPDEIFQTDSSSKPGWVVYSDGHTQEALQESNFNLDHVAREVQAVSTRIK